MRHPSSLCVFSKPTSQPTDKLRCESLKRFNSAKANSSREKMGPKMVLCSEARASNNLITVFAAAVVASIFFLYNGGFNL
jgi:hypothetical protein